MIEDIHAALHIVHKIRAALPGDVVEDDDPEVEPTSRRPLHPFDQRNIHAKLHGKARRLFDDGHFSEATFEAAKYVERAVRSLAGMPDKSGYALMMAAFNEKAPAIRLTQLVDTSEIDEQLGFKFMFAGLASAIRNPRGHEPNFSETLDDCVDHLVVISFLLRRIEEAGYTLP